MLSHTYEIYGGRLVGNTSHEFSHNENAVLSYSTTQKVIMSKLLTNSLLLCPVQRSLNCSMVPIMASEKAVLVSTFIAPIVAMSLCLCSCR